MKTKGNDTITVNKEAGVSDCACEEKEEPSPFLYFPFPFILVVRWQNIWTLLKKG
jgi:hypothetical protein